MQLDLQPHYRRVRERATSYTCVFTLLYMAASSPDDIVRLLNLGVTDSSALADVIPHYFDDDRACEHHETESDRDSDSCSEGGDELMEEHPQVHGRNVVNKPQLL